MTLLNDVQRQKCLDCIKKLEEAFTNAECGDSLTVVCWQTIRDSAFLTNGRDPSHSELMHLSQSLSDRLLASLELAQSKSSSNAEKGSPEFFAHSHFGSRGLQSIGRHQQADVAFQILFPKVFGPQVFIGADDVPDFTLPEAVPVAAAIVGLAKCFLIHKIKIATCSNPDCAGMHESYFEAATVPNASTTLSIPTVLASNLCSGQAMNVLPQNEQLLCNTCHSGTIVHTSHSPNSEGCLILPANLIPAGSGSTYKKNLDRLDSNRFAIPGGRVAMLCSATQYLAPEEHFFTFAETILSGPTKCSIIDSLAHYHGVETPYWGMTSHDGDTMLTVWNLHRADTCIMFFTIDQGGDPNTVFNPSLGMLGAPPAISLHSTPTASPNKSPSPPNQRVSSIPPTRRLSAGVGRVRSHAPSPARRIGSFRGKAIYSAAPKNGGQMAPTSPLPLSRTRTLSAPSDDDVSFTLSPPTPVAKETAAQPSPAVMNGLASEMDPPAAASQVPAQPEESTVAAALDNADVVPPPPAMTAPSVTTDNSVSTSQDIENVCGNGRHHCGCITGCGNNRCGCRKSGMKCGPECSCDSSCKNKVTDESTPTSGDSSVSSSNTSMSLRSGSSSRATPALVTTISGDAAASSNTSMSLHSSSTTPCGITLSTRPRRSSSSKSAGASSGLPSRPPLGASNGGP